MGRTERELETLKREVAELRDEIQKMKTEIHRLKINVQPPRDSEAARHQKARMPI